MDEESIEESEPVDELGSAVGNSSAVEDSSINEWEDEKCGAEEENFWAVEESRAWDDEELEIEEETRALEEIEDEWPVELILEDIIEELEEENSEEENSDEETSDEEIGWTEEEIDLVEDENVRVELSSELDNDEEWIETSAVDDSEEENSSSDAVELAISLVEEISFWSPPVEDSSIIWYIILYFGRVSAQGWPKIFSLKFWPKNFISKIPRPRVATNNESSLTL